MGETSSLDAATLSRQGSERNGPGIGRLSPRLVPVVAHSVFDNRTRWQGICLSLSDWPGCRPSKPRGCATLTSGAGPYNNRPGASHLMAMYSFRNIPDDVWRRFQARLQLDGVSSRVLGAQLLDIYARCGLQVLEETADRVDPPKRPRINS